MFGRSKKQQSEEPGDFDPSVPRQSTNTERTLTPWDEKPSLAVIKRATRTRYIWSLICSFLLLLSVIFMILVEVGDTSTASVRTKIYFLKLNLTNVVPETTPDSGLINSIAQTLGLHDWYTVGLWGFCQGYNNSPGSTQCSKPQTLYWFNPVEILLNELLAGASIALPTEVTDDLDLVKIASRWMFGLFLSGACLSFVMIFMQPLSVYSRWVSWPVALFTFLAALLTTAASVIATVMWIIFRDALTSVTEVNIGASVGTEMFVFMWIASGTAIIAWFITMGQWCCCASRRDVRRGKRKGSKKAYQTETVGVANGAPMEDGMTGAALSDDTTNEKPKKKRFGRK